MNKDDLKSIIIIALSVLICCICFLCRPANATGYDSDGNMYIKDGDWIYSNSGEMYWKDGDYYFNSDSDMYYDSGDFIFSPDGDMYLRDGNTVYTDDGWYFEEEE